MTVSDTDEAYNFYCNSAHTLGFSVRKYKQYFSEMSSKLKRK